MLPIIGAVAAVFVVIVGVFYFNTSEELTTKKVVISSKPLVFVSSIDSSRLSDDDKKYVEGITGNVISSLSKSKSIRLVPTKTAQSFEKNEISSEQLFKTHGVKFLVSSSLQIVDSDARVNIEISDLEKKQIVISSIKDLKLKSIFEFQDQFGESILSEFLANILNQKGLYESYFSWREVPITPQQLLQYVNFRSEMAKWTEEGYVNASTILSEMKKWPGTNRPEDWLVQDTWLNFFGMAKKKIPATPENLKKLKIELDKTIEIKPSPENYGSRALLSFGMGMIGCKEAIEDLKLAHRKAGNSDSYGYASIIYGRCGYPEEAAKYAKNAFNLQPIDTNWRSTSRLAFRLYENNQQEEMYLLIDDIVEAVDFPAALLALIAYDKLKNGDEETAKYYFSKAKAKRYSKSVLAQAIYNKDIREDAITTLESFKY
jgi:TolB-like protein